MKGELLFQCGCFFDYAIFSLARSIALKECYLMMNFENIHFTVLKKSFKSKFEGQTLIKCNFLEGRLPEYFFQEYVPLVVSKLCTKFQQLSLLKTVILEHP